MSTVDPLAVPLVVEVGPDLGPDGFVQLGRVPGAHGSLGEFKEKSATLRKDGYLRMVVGSQ